MRLLIDNSILHHAVAIKGTWKDNGTVFWGGEIPVRTGQIESVLYSHKIKPSKGGDQTMFIAALAEEFGSGRIKAFYSDALKFETLHLPGGRFKGANYGDMSLFANVTCEKLTTLDGFSLTIPSDDPIEKLREYLRACQAPGYRKILQALESVITKPEKKLMASQDAWHLYTVISNGLDAFLTVDTTLIGQIKSLPAGPIGSELRGLVHLPSEICEKLGIDAMREEELTKFVSKLGSFPRENDGG